MAFDFESVKRWNYVLELERGNYYVGQTDNLENRFKRHTNKKGAQWTRIYAPDHQIGKGNGSNQKYISPDGHREVVIKGNVIDTSAKNGGTFNFYGPRYKGGEPHLKYDVLPYFIHGNIKTGYWDATFSERMGATYKYLRIK